MEATYQYQRLFDLLMRAKRVLVVGHKKPDGDALGASTALYHWLKGQNKTVALFCLDAPSPAFAYLDHYYDLTTNPLAFDAAYDAVVVLDSGDLHYCGIEKLMPKLPIGYQLIDLDHHATNAHFGDFNLVFPEVSSTSEILYRFFSANRIKIDAAAATALMTGILFDTHSFTNAATRPESLEAVSRLVAAGARTSEIAKALYKNKDAATLRLWGVALSRLKHNPKYNLAVTYLKADDLARAGTTSSATEGISNFLSTVCGGAEILLVLTQADEMTIKGSFRSVKTDVSKIAQLLGGGGHKLAAGFSLPGRIVEMENGFRIT